MRWAGKIRKSIFSLDYRLVRERFYRTIEQQVFEIKEEPKKVALGCALGIGINFFPTLGAGFILAFILASLFRINKASAAITSLLTGPLVPLMYALNLFIGGTILAPAMGTESFFDFVARQYLLVLKVTSFREKIFSFLELLGITFLTGALINALFFSALAYFLAGMILKRLIKGKKVTWKSGDGRR